MKKAYAAIDISLKSALKNGGRYPDTIGMTPACYCSNLSKRKIGGIIFDLSSE
jgi:hypothetical protein